MPDPSKLDSLYGNLKKDGYDLPDIESFKKDMSDEGKISRLHSNLKNDGYELPDFATFQADMGLKKKEPSVSTSPSSGGASQSGSKPSKVSALEFVTAAQKEAGPSAAYTEQPEEVKTPEGKPKTNFEQRIENPVLKIKNKDGSVSTHKMMSFESDGKFYAAPTIVEQDGKLKELPEEQAIDYAFKTGELKEFKSQEEAQRYAEGGYKKGTALDPYAEFNKRKEGAIPSESTSTSFIKQKPLEEEKIKAENTAYQEKAMKNVMAQSLTPSVGPEKYIGIQLTKPEDDKSLNEKAFRATTQEKEAIIQRAKDKGVSEEFANQQYNNAVNKHIEDAAKETAKVEFNKTLGFLPTVEKPGEVKLKVPTEEEEKMAASMEAMRVMDYGKKHLDPRYQSLVPLTEKYYKLVNEQKEADPEKKEAINQKLTQAAYELKRARDIVDLSFTKDYTDPVTGKNGTEESKAYTGMVNDAVEKYKGTAREKLMSVYSGKAHELQYLEKEIQGHEPSAFPLTPVGIKEKNKYGLMDDEIRRRKAEFEALTQALFLNQDPSSLERGLAGGFVSAAKKAVVESFGGKETTNTDTAQRVHSALSEAGIQTTPELNERIKLTVAEQGGSVAGELPRLALEFAVGGGLLSGAMKIAEVASIVNKGAKAIEVFMGNSKAGTFMANVVKDAVKGGAEGAVVSNVLGDKNIGAGMMSGEKVVEGIFDRLNPINKTIGAIAKEYLAKVAGGTIGEYTGDYINNAIDAFEKGGFNTHKIFEDTFGRTPTEQGDKLLIIAMMSVLGGAGKAAGDVISNFKLAKKAMEESGDTKGLEELNDLADKSGIDINEKPTTNDQENKPGVQSSVGEGQEPVIDGPVTPTSETPVSTDRVLQKEGEVKEYTRNDAVNAYSKITDIESEDTKESISEFLSALAGKEVHKAGSAKGTSYIETGQKINGKDVVYRIGDHSHHEENIGDNKFLISFVVGGKYGKGISETDNSLEVRLGEVTPKGMDSAIEEIENRLSDFHSESLKQTKTTEPSKETTIFTPEETAKSFEEITAKSQEVSDLGVGGTRREGNRELAEKRRALMEADPTVKKVYTNLKEVYDQLAEKGILTKKGDC